MGRRISGIARVLRAIVLATGLATTSAAVAQTVRTESVLPVSTDPAITGWFGAHYVAYATDITHRNQLFVYIHGQGGTGAGATELVKSAAELGFHAVGLTYPNDWSPFIVCGTDAACPENLRREIIDGTDRTPLITVTRPNSLENRLIKLLVRLEVLHPGEAWTQFVNGEQLLWDQIVVWGHSQGGGNAAVIARHHVLARVCMSAPAADGGPGNPAAWWATHATPDERYFGFCHTQDQLSTKVAFWDALGMDAFGEVLDVVGSSPPYGSTHKLSASAAPVIANQYHNSVVADNLTPRDANNVPIYKPAWQYMMATVIGPPQPPTDDVVFATVSTFNGSIDLMMDIHPATSGTGPRPLLVWIHGGGWQGGSHNQTPSFALDLRAQGIHVASIGYRLSGEAIFPAQIHDCKGAIRWLRAHAVEYEIDVARIGVWGSSAGGHLAALVATSGGVADLEGTSGGNTAFSSSVIACGDFYGPTDILNMQLDCQAQAPGCSFDHDDPTSPESKLFGLTAADQGIGWLRTHAANPAPPFPELLALVQSANPLTHVDAADPPFFIAHGDQDTTVPLGQSTKLRDALNAVGVANTYTVAAGFGHGSLGATVNAAATAWMADRLLNACPAGSFTPGDVNHDGAINGRDISAFVALLGSTGPANAGYCAADANHDGTIGEPDVVNLVVALVNP